MSERTNWRTFQFLLENTVFLLIGLQTRWILDDLTESPLPTWLIATTTVAVFVAVILLRPIWVIPTTMLSRRFLGPSRPGPVSRSALIVVSWAGMRGVVTLAAVFTLPEDTPHREVLVFIALAVTAGTLLVQGSTLPWLVRRLRLPGPDPAEDALQEAAVLQGAHRAAIAKLDEISAPTDPPAILDVLRQRGEARAQAAWERLGRPETEYETPSEAYRRLRIAMLEAERAHILKVRDAGLVADEVLQRAQNALDIEESILDRDEDDDVGGRSEDLRPKTTSAACEHLEQAPVRGHAEHTGRLRGVPGRRRLVGPPAAVPGVRPRRVLRLVGDEARQQAQRPDQAPGDAQLRAGRDVALVLRRREARLTVWRTVSSAPSSPVRRRRRSCSTHPTSWDSWTSGRCSRATR